MLLSVFEKYIFLQSLGWGIANSLWQAALLWMAYQFVVSANKKLPALFKHHFSLLLQLASFGWFVSTVVQNYLLIKKSGTETAGFSWLGISNNFSQSLQWLSVVYFALLAVHMVLFAKKLQGLFALQKSCFTKAPVDVRIFTEQTAFHIGIKKKVGIWLSEKAYVPSVVGFLKPVILLPVAMLGQLTTEQAEAVILHELAHIKRNDYLVNFIQSIIELVLFFNPFARMLGNAARKERENCCDDWVVNYQYNKHDYAAALMLLEQNRHAPTEFALAATNGKKYLLARVKRLFAEEPKTSFTFLQKIQLLSVAFAVLFMVLLALPVANKVDENRKSETVDIATPFVIPVAYAYNETKEQQSSKAASVKAAKVKRNKEASPIAIGSKNAVVDKQTPVEEVECNTALINEELLQDKSLELQDMAIQAAQKELAEAKKIIVQIEEEQSGTKDKNTYLVELNNNNGKPQVKPLIILSKKVKPAAKAKVKQPALQQIPKKKVST